MNPNAFDIHDANASLLRKQKMDKHRVFVIGLLFLALVVIGAAVWTIFTPPFGDEVQSYALVAIGVFMLIIGYDISRRKPN
jgi:hypothetical protein